MVFPCSKCGACCKNIKNIEQLKDFDSGNGVCRFFDTKLNICKIYDIRPQVCRIDAMYEKFYKHVYDKKDFYI